MYNLGLMYDRGESVEKNFETALEWYRKAAEKHNSKALNMLGRIYELGDGVEKNLDLAAKFYE